MLLHLGPNVITFRTLLHLGQLLHLGLQQGFREDQYTSSMFYKIFLVRAPEKRKLIFVLL